MSDIDKARRKAEAKARAAVDEKIIARAAHLLGPCQNAANHTPVPFGYIARAEWAERMAKTHRQTKCPGCGLWMIWVPR